MLWFIFHSGSLLLEKNGDTLTVPRGDASPVATDARACTVPPMPDGEEVMTMQIAELPPSSAFVACPLRQTFYHLPEALYLKAGQCQELNHFHEHNRFCGRCGTEIERNSVISRHCPGCANEVFPQLSIAVIVLIKRGEEALLVKARNFRRDFYGLVAGFVETAESLEQAVEREVMEETGLRIRNLRYVLSQPWPFPSGLMAGFAADWQEGEIQLQAEELVDARWFDKDSLPNLPEPMSIARRLIDKWLRGEI